MIQKSATLREHLNTLFASIVRFTEDEFCNFGSAAIIVPSPAARQSKAVPRAKAGTFRVLLSAQAKKFPPYKRMTPQKLSSVPVHKPLDRPKYFGDAYMKELSQPDPAAIQE
jgi:hypothetical protein